MNRHSSRKSKQLPDLPKGVDLTENTVDLSLSNRDKSNRPSLVDTSSPNNSKLASQEFKAGQLKSQLANATTTPRRGTLMEDKKDGTPEMVSDQQSNIEMLIQSEKSAQD